MIFFVDSELQNSWKHVMRSYIVKVVLWRYSKNSSVSVIDKSVQQSVKKYRKIFVFSQIKFWLVKVLCTLPKAGKQLHISNMEHNILKIFLPLNKVIFHFEYLNILAQLNIFIYLLCLYYVRGTILLLHIEKGTNYIDLPTISLLFILPSPGQNEIAVKFCLKVL